MISFCRKSAEEINHENLIFHHSLKKIKNQILFINQAKYFQQLIRVLILILHCFILHPSIARSEIPMPTGISVRANCVNDNNCTISITRGDAIEIKEKLTRAQTNAELKKISDEIGGRVIDVSRTSTFIPEYYPSKENPQERKLTSTCNYKSMTCQVEYSINGVSLFKGEIPKSENDKAFDDMDTDKGPLVGKVGSPPRAPEPNPPLFVSPTIATSLPVASPAPPLPTVNICPAGQIAMMVVENGVAFEKCVPAAIIDPPPLPPQSCTVNFAGGESISAIGATSESNCKEACTNTKKIIDTLSQVLDLFTAILQGSGGQVPNIDLPKMDYQSCKFGDKVLDGGTNVCDPKRCPVQRPPKCDSGEKLAPVPQKPPYECCLPLMECVRDRVVPPPPQASVICSYAVPGGGSIGTTFKGQDIATLQAKCDKYCKEASERNPGLRRRGAVCTGGTGATENPSNQTTRQTNGGKTKKNCDNVTCNIPVSPCQGGKLVSDGECCSKWECPAK